MREREGQGGVTRDKVAADAAVHRCSDCMHRENRTRKEKGAVPLAAAVAAPLAKGTARC